MNLMSSIASTFVGSTIASVSVGPYSIIGEHVRIGAGTRIGPHVVIEGHTSIGRDNHIYSYAALGGNPKRDVVDARGRSWDVDGLYVADSSIFPTSLGVNPCYTVYALGRYIAQGIIEDIRM